MASSLSEPQSHQLVHADAFPDPSPSILRLYPKVQPPEPRKMTSTSAVDVREHAFDLQTVGWRASKFCSQDVIKGRERDPFGFFPFNHRIH
jgi:hypothetical protein